ncbi:MAG: hypothetical protein AB7S78_13075 [Candidatus Omnitrophota bacterium]
MNDRYNLFKEKKDPVQQVANIFYIIALVITVGYFLLTIKAVRGLQHEYRESYRIGRMSKDQFEQKILEMTYLKMLLSPDKVFNSLFQ